MIIHQPDLDPEWNRALARAGYAHALSFRKDEWRVEQAAFPRDRS